MNSKSIKAAISPFIMKFIQGKQKTGYYLTDLYESLFGLREELIPPRHRNFVGDGDFKQIGDDFLQLFIEPGGLTPTDRILDVGCGIGRMALPLTSFVSKEGSYEGIDIVASGIKWCRDHITPRFPNFRFQLADVYNRYYNRKGKCRSSDYHFPFADHSFDFIFLTSVFTHMLPSDVENYMSEIARVLKPGGRCFITFFLLNNESLSLMKNKQSIFDFSVDCGGYHTTNPEVPEVAIAYKEEDIRNLYCRNGLQLSEPIHYGSWCSRTGYLSFQDIIISTKRKI